MPRPQVLKRDDGGTERVVITKGMVVLTFRCGPDGNVYEEKALRRREDRGDFDSLWLPNAIYRQALAQANAIFKDRTRSTKSSR